MTDLPSPKLPCSHEIASGASVTLADICEIQHSILENAGRLVIATNTAGTILYANAAARRELGYAWNELVGKCSPEIFHLPRELQRRSRELSLELGETVEPGLATLIAEARCKSPQEREWTYVRQDGSTFPVALTISPLHDRAGNQVGFVGIAADITERLRLEQELRVAATAFDSQAAILITDSQQRILRVNAAFTRLTGYTAEEAIGQTPALLKSNRQDPGFYRTMWEELGKHGHWQGEIWNRRKNGEVFPEWLTIATVRDPAGQLTHYVATFSDISNLKVAESEIHNLAFYDPLTGLPNRRLLLNRLGQALATSNRSRQYGALLIVDLDHFKNLNDTLGHDVGDRLLVEVASRLKSCIREGDTAARPGGDEFVVMLEDLGIDRSHAAIQAEAVAEKIRDRLNSPYGLGGSNDYFNAASIGISLYRGHEKTTEALLKQADIALYKAKDAGRNAIRFFDDAMQIALEARASLEAGLRQAICRGEFALHLQPQVDADRRIVGAEALLRWQPAGDTMISPAEFIPLAEETGLIVPIGLWVLDAACAELRRWSAQPGMQDLHMAVNVSARQFRQPDFVEQVEAALERHGIAPGLLKLELTESLLLDSTDNTVAKMDALRNLGVRFSLDDFGTGYASLSYLKRFPFSQLKVDQTFIRGLATDPDDAAIVRAIIAMGQTLRLKVIAEGVETEEQSTYLEKHGCSVFQGYLFGRPMAISEFTAHVAENQRRYPEPQEDWVI